MLKVVIVTSEINYMPENYNSLIEGLLGAQSEDFFEISAVISLETLDKKLLSPLVKMPFVGMFGLFTQIIKNIKAEKIDNTRKQICEKYNSPLIHAKSMNNKEIIRWIKEKNIDLILNLRTRCIYKKSILEAPNIACINIHHGILPNFRGTFCDLYALSEYREAGYSIHRMVKKIDDGEVYKVKTVHTRKQGEKINYLTYLSQTIDHEITDLRDLLKEISKNSKLPKALDFSNDSTDIVYTKNPTPKKIVSIMRQGIKL